MLPLIFLLATAPQSAPTRWSVVLGGDLMFNGVKPGPQNLAGVRPLLVGSTVAMANLEVPITNRGRPTARKSKAELKARTQFILRADPEHRASLDGSGIRMVTMGNNHCMDFGQAGIQQEMEILDGLGILHSGAGLTVADAERPAVYRTASGLRIGLVSFMAFATKNALLKTTPATVVSPGVAVLNLGGLVDGKARLKLAARLALARSACDVLIVGIHWGVERRVVPNGYQVALGRALVDAGADVVWGHHPHVVQGAEVYKGKPILYSAGNLISALPAATGLFRLTMNDGRYVTGEFFPAAISHGAARLVLGAANEAAVREFHRLCQEIQTRFPSEDSRAFE